MFFVFVGIEIYKSTTQNDEYNQKASDVFDFKPSDAQEIRIEVGQKKIILKKVS